MSTLAARIMRRHDDVADLKAETDGKVAEALDQALDALVRAGYAALQEARAA